MTPRAYGYARLSREDAADGKSVTEKLEDRAGQVRALATQHGLTLLDILTEQESGVTIADRPQLRRLLDLCRRHECTHIVTPEQARVLRGDKRDEAEIEDVLSEANITLISHEGMLEFGSDEFDPLPYEVRALVARHELRQFVKRRRRANAEKLRQNKRYGGPCPYGYILDPATTYQPDPRTYPTLCRILREHIAGKSLNRLMLTLEDEGILSPRGKTWSRTTLRSIVLNPVYAGRHAQQFRTVRLNGKKILRPIPVTEWIVSELPGTWEHPITFEDWLQIRNRYAGNSKVYYPVAMLSGLLACQEGHQMISSGERAYTCMSPDRHPGMSVNKPRMEALVYEAIASIIEHLPPDILGERGAVYDTASLQREYDRALKIAREATEAHEDLINRALYYQRLFDMDATRFEELVHRRANEKRAAQDTLAALHARLNEPQRAQIAERVTAIRAVGFEAFWKAATMDARRAIVAMFTERLSVPPKQKFLAHTRGLHITYRQWCASFVPVV